MAIYRTDDPLKDFARHERDQQRMLDLLPVCSKCGEPIQESHAYFTLAEVWVCDDCADAECTEDERRAVDDYVY